MEKHRSVIFILILSVLVVLFVFYVYTAPAKTVWSFSSFGEDDYLYNPSDIEVDLSGSLIYIADSGNDRVLVFDFDGKCQKIIGRTGQGPAEFSNPSLTTRGAYIMKGGTMDEYRGG